MSKLFTPLRIGDLDLSHRVIMAPLTRYRADDDHVPLDFVADYYAQRASVPGTLLITEATFISPRAGGFSNAPGIYNAAQIAAWRKVTDAVHKKGSYIFLQLWALGRAADADVLRSEGYEVVSSSTIPMNEKAAIPRALNEAEIQQFVEDYAQAARNANEAGFDGVEIHGANGYLCDQFLEDTCNDRTDRWGGSIKNRARFGIEVAKAVTAAIGSERTGYRVSPYSPFQGMRMQGAEQQFSYLAQELKKLKLAYLHVVESRVSGAETIIGVEKLDWLVNLWADTSPIVLAGGFTPDSALVASNRYGEADVAVAFGRSFLANPDLPFRISKGLGLNNYNRTTFYVPMSREGYLDYPFSAEFMKDSSLLNGTAV